MDAPSAMEVGSSDESKRSSDHPHPSRPGPAPPTISAETAPGAFFRDSQGESWRRALRGRVVPKRILESLELVVEAS